MRPKDIIADFLVRKKLVPDGADPVELAQQLIDELDRENLVIDYPMDECC